MLPVPHLGGRGEQRCEGRGPCGGRGVAPLYGCVPLLGSLARDRGRLRGKERYRYRRVELRGEGYGLESTP